MYDVLNSVALILEAGRKFSNLETVKLDMMMTGNFDCTLRLLCSKPSILFQISKNPPFLIVDIHLLLFLQLIFALAIFS